MRGTLRACGDGRSHQVRDHAPTTLTLRPRRGLGRGSSSRGGYRDHSEQTPDRGRTAIRNDTRCHSAGSKEAPINALGWTYGVPEVGLPL
jgi:hypothetical protein